MRRSAVETGFLGNSPPRRVRPVKAQDPLFWLHRGAGDVSKAPAVSLIFGSALYGTAEIGRHLLTQSPATTLAYSAVLMVAALVMAAALCAGSRHVEQARSGSLRAVFGVLWGRKSHLFLLALSIAALTMGWFQLASHILIADAAVSGSFGEGFTITAATPGWFAMASLAFVTGAIALLIIGVTSIGLPLVIDGDNDFLKAMITSGEVFARNPGATLVWTLATAASLALGFFVSLLAMAACFTVISHATWHAYRSTIETT